MGESPNRESRAIRKAVRRFLPRTPGSDRESWRAPARARRGRAREHARGKKDPFPRLHVRRLKTHAPEATPTIDDNGGRKRQNFFFSNRGGYWQSPGKRATESRPPSP